MWPFGNKGGKEKVEVRQQAYTDALIAGIVNSAQGREITAVASAALEAAAGTISRAFFSSEVEAPEFINSGLLVEIARDLIRQGEACYRITANPIDGIVLERANTWFVLGGSRPESWRYTMNLPAPSQTITRNVGYSDVLHFRYATTPSQPWKGLGPIQWAAGTSELLGALNRSLSQESKHPVGSMLPAPEDPTTGIDPDDPESAGPYSGLLQELRNSNGRMHMVETARGGQGLGPSDAPRNDWVPQRFGPNIPQSSVSLYERIGIEILGACGVSPSLFSSSGGGETGSREAFRRFVISTVQPLAELIAIELRQKLEMDVAITFRQVGAADLVSRARAFGSLMGNPQTPYMEVPRALEISGLE